MALCTWLSPNYVCRFRVFSAMYWLIQKHSPRSETRENEQIETGAAKGRNRKICGLLMRMRSTHNLTLYPVDVLVY